MSDEFPQSVLSQIRDTLAVDSSGQPAACILCQRLLSSNNEGGDLEALSICGDCKFLFLEDLESPVQEGYRRRHGFSRRRRRRNTSFESMENLFPQHFAQMIDLARNNQAILLDQDNQSFNGDALSRLSHHLSSHTTPSGSRRWRRVLSDTESDGFVSVYGESETNISFAGYRHFHGDSDTLSYSAYGGESDASVGGNSFLENETFVNPDGSSDFDSDTDIDPMHAGLYPWNSDDQEEEAEDDEDNEWEEGDMEENTVDSWRVRARLQRSISPNQRWAAVNLHRRVSSFDYEETTVLGVHERRRAHNYGTLDEGESHNSAEIFEDFPDARALEVLQHLSENENSRSGAPPAAVSFVKNLPRIVVNKDHGNLDDLACAICKDSISVGTVVNQLPCFHLYHPSCIIPWLSTRNSCPLCRQEFPTDDKDYENRKQMGNRQLDLHHIRQQDLNGYSSSDNSAEADEHNDLGNDRTVVGVDSNVNVVAHRRGRLPTRRSFFPHAVAAPIVSVVGIVLVLWLGNSLTTRRLPSGPPAIHGQRHHPNTYIGRSPPNQRVDGGRRRWWFIF